MDKYWAVKKFGKAWLFYNIYQQPSRKPGGSVVSSEVKSFVLMYLMIVVWNNGFKGAKFEESQHMEG